MTASTKIADFGMSRDLSNETYYISNAKKIPIKWTAPEVSIHNYNYNSCTRIKCLVSHGRKWLHIYIVQNSYDIFGILQYINV